MDLSVNIFQTFENDQLKFLSIDCILEQLTFGAANLKRLEGNQTIFHYDILIQMRLPYLDLIGTVRGKFRLKQNRGVDPAGAVYFIAISWLQAMDSSRLNEYPFRRAFTTQRYDHDLFKNLYILYMKQKSQHIKVFKKKVYIAFYLQ